MANQLMPAIEVDRVRGLELMHPFGKIRLGRRGYQMEVILHQDVTVHFDLVAFGPFGQIGQEPRPILVVPENLFPSIAARQGVVEGAGKPNPRRSRHPHP